MIGKQQEGLKRTFDGLHDWPKLLETGGGNHCTVNYLLLDYSALSFVGGGLASAPGRWGSSTVAWSEL